MRIRRSMAVLLAGALLGPLALASCRSGNAYDVDTNQPDRILLNVKNDNFLDMDIYALSSGLPSRIGTVSGVNSAHFALDPTLYGASDFRIVATPIGGNGRASSGPLVVSRGQTIEFTIGSRLAQSHAEVR